MPRIEAKPGERATTPQPAAVPLRPFRPVEPAAARSAQPEKTVAIPRADMDFHDYEPRPRATPSLRPVPAYPPVSAHDPVITARDPVVAAPDPLVAAFVSAPAAVRAPEKTLVIPSGGTTSGEYPPPDVGGSDAPLLELNYRALGAHASEARRRPWKMRAFWLIATLAAVVIGWFYTHKPAATRAAQPASGILGGTFSAAPPPATGPEPGSIIQDCPTCPPMTVLPPGRFKQGSAYDDHDALAAEKPQHIVRIRKPLAMATTELTVANFRQFVIDTKRDLQGCETYDGEWHHKAGASWLDPGFTQADNHPVTCVSWNDAVAYARWLSAKTGHHYRLPSASEWEYAARAGSDAQVPWSPGLQAACENANVADRSAARRYPKWSVFACKDGYVNTAPVGSFKANPFGIDDMLGNVFEWTQDCWHDDYSKAPIDGAARTDGDCNEHELRGGSWFSSPAFVRLAYRTHYATGYRSASIGVRLVRDMTP